MSRVRQHLCQQGHVVNTSESAWMYDCAICNAPVIQVFQEGTIDLKTIKTIPGETKCVGGKQCIVYSRYSVSEIETALKKLSKKGKEHGTSARA